VFKKTLNNYTGRAKPYEKKMEKEYNEYWAAQKARDAV
jgi:hypothetical protein